MVAAAVLVAAAAVLVAVVVIVAVLAEVVAVAMVVRHIFAFGRSPNLFLREWRLTTD